MYAKAGVPVGKPTEFVEGLAEPANDGKPPAVPLGMPIRLLRHSKLDFAAWDACINSAPQVVPYAASWWLRATAGQWDALVETDEHTGRYRAVWPLPVKRRPGGREVYQPPFTQQLGIIGAGNDIRVWLEEYAACRAYSRFYTQLSTDNGLPPARPPMAVHLRQTYHLSLAGPYETIRAGYCADYRRRLRLSETDTQPPVLSAVSDAEPLLALFRQTQGPAAGLKKRHYARLRRLVAALQARQLLELHEVRATPGGPLLAGALFVRYRSRLIYLFAAASVEGKKAAAPLLLVDAAIRRHAGTPGLVLDFEGGMIPSIARFFANFGAVPVPYAALSFTQQRPWYLQWMR
ncbi:GNAT family N-acetyltransferase [Hymenobacter metallilatus]|uniref:GNAT family N-acetyltransferase n=1 Tax=Hymenobacter metallilatus TaxID=2493666 RepID=A0A428IY19_9BACT|nr:GNAT family N-acetyltransferase [Hymenobacter metallilatus]RSK23839.1 GNAT family N-acetyltransferase [Hymenobacter metallilatus]